MGWDNRPGNWGRVGKLPQTSASELVAGWLTVRNVFAISLPHSPVLLAPRLLRLIAVVLEQTKNKPGISVTMMTARVLVVGQPASQQWQQQEQQKH